MMRGACDPADAPAAWREFHDELDRWTAAGRVATLWWRDDDAVAPTAQLDRVLALAEATPLALAVVPATARPELVSVLAERAQVAVLQHGWRHHNHGGDGKKSEFPQGRDPVAVAAELASGRDRLGALFGDQALPVLAPPWNRIAEEFLPLFGAAGLKGLSRCGPGLAPASAAGVDEIDVHADLVAWRDGRGFVGEAAALSRLTGHLQARRRGEADPDAPTGILTHHLVQDRATELFLAALFAVTGAHRARWLDAREMFAVT